jgi:hypothetical protein
MAQSRLSLGLMTTRRPGGLNRGLSRQHKATQVRGRTYRESYDKLVLCLGAEPVPRAATLTSTATRSPGSRALAWFALADLAGHSRMFALCTKGQSLP